MRVSHLIKSIFMLMVLLAIVAGCSESSTNNSQSSTGANPVTTSTGKGTTSTIAGVTAAKPATTSVGPSTSGETDVTDTTNAATSQYTTTGDSGSTDQDSGTTVQEEEEAQQTGSQFPGTLVPGTVDNTGGPLAEHRMVSFYGHPFAAAMGVLGQYEPQEMVSLLKEQAAAYTKIDPERPAICTIELIASVAQPEPGADGLYLTRTPPEVIEQYANLAKDNDCLLLLDVQIGYSTIADEVQVLMPYLKLPYVHLAIDPEYDMAPGEIPGQQVGASYASEIAGAAQTLSNLVDQNEELQAKVLVIHQFQYGMILNKETLRPVRNVEMVLHADGFGTPRVKYDKYNALVTQEPIQYGGFKLFYNQDAPLLSPTQVLSDLNPPPAVVSYQ